MSGRGVVEGRLARHVESLEGFFGNASDFLVRCQIGEPYVLEGTLRGCVCPWEIGVADTWGLTVHEDFHDTLQAVWTWSYYTGISGKDTYMSNVDMAWDYVTANSQRFIRAADEDIVGSYDCSHLVLCGSQYESVYGDKTYRRLVQSAGERLARYLLLAGSSGQGYSDWMIESCWAWWTAYCLASAARFSERDEWLEAARVFVKRTVMEERILFPV